MLAYYFFMFEMAVARRWGRWEWTVSDHTGKIIMFGWQVSRSAARDQSARALFQLLLTSSRIYNPP